MSRPKFATGKGDANHMMIRDFLRDGCGGFEVNQIGGHTCYFANYHGDVAWAIDTGKLGGLFLDWIVGIEDIQSWVEVKTPEAYASAGNGLQPGERWTIENLPLKRVIVSTDQQVADLFHRLREQYLRGWAE